MSISFNTSLLTTGGWFFILKHIRFSSLMFSLSAVWEANFIVGIIYDNSTAKYFWIIISNSRGLDPPRFHRFQGFNKMTLFGHCRTLTVDWGKLTTARDKGTDSSRMTNWSLISWSSPGADCAKLHDDFDLFGNARITSDRSEISAVAFKHSKPITWRVLAPNYQR